MSQVLEDGGQAAAAEGGVTPAPVQETEWAVFRLEENRARLRPVTLGHRSTRDLEVVSGLAPGDRVVLYPGDRLADGKEVMSRQTR